MTDYKQILYDVSGGIGTITTNRPGVRNAQSRVLLEEMDDAFARAGHDPAVRVIVLRGAGDHFSGGHDLGTPEEVADRKARPAAEGLRGRYERSWDLYVDATLRWRNVPKPTIAAVHGYCIFGGWMIASACDVIFAAEDALFLPTNFQELPFLVKKKFSSTLCPSTLIHTSICSRRMNVVCGVTS